MGGHCPDKAETGWLDYHSSRNGYLVRLNHSRIELGDLNGVERDAMKQMPMIVSLQYPLSRLAFVASFISRFDAARTYMVSELPDLLPRTEVRERFFSDDVFSSPSLCHG